MSRRMLGIVTAILVVVGAGLMSVPVGILINRYCHAAQAVEGYKKAEEKMDNVTGRRQLNLARWYNLSLRENTYREDMQEAYGAVLNIHQGIMGYLEVREEGWILPIYHGDSQDDTGYSLTHLPGSAFPVGGKGNHTILFGPRLISQLREEMTFCVHIPGKCHVFRVEKVRKASPGDTAGLAPGEGEDRCTLITTVPRGFGQEKIIVYGIRTEESAIQINSEELENLIVLCVMCILAVLLIPYIAGSMGSWVRRMLEKRFCGSLTK